MSPLSALRRVVTRYASAVPGGRPDGQRSHAEEDDLPPDVVFDLLSNPRRRFAICHLEAADDPVEVATLAEEIAAWENGVDADDLTRQQRKRVYVSLYQTQIPKLETHGLVDADEDAGVVEWAGHTDEITHHLTTGGRGARWRRYYLALSVGGAALFLGAARDVGPLAALAEAAAVGLLFVAVGVLALVHRRHLQVSERRALLELVEREQ